MFGQGLLALVGAVFFGLGVVCLYDPILPAQWSGLNIESDDSYAELAAMYGGLQIAIGSILFASAMIKEYLKAGLWLMFVIVGYIAAARLGTVVYVLYLEPSTSLKIGVEVAPSFTTYTWGVLAFELVVTALALFALVNRPRT